MGKIWEDKKVIEIIKFLKDNKRTVQFQNKVVPKFVFVCGKQILDDDGNIFSDEQLRDNIRYYILNSLDKKIKNIDYGRKIKLVSGVVSEKLYQQDWAEDILSFEELLADISEYIVIVVESEGTYCELGAFVMNDDFMKKTIIINSDNPAYAKSFITRGPIKKVKDKNPERVILHNGISRIRTSTEFNEKLNELAAGSVPIKPNNNIEELSLKYLIYEFANIVELFQPLEEYEIQKIYKNIYDIETYDIKNRNKNKIRTFKQVIELMENMDLITKKNGMCYLKEDNTFYNVISNINRRKFNELRVKYLSRIYKLQPERME